MKKFLSIFFILFLTTSFTHAQSWVPVGSPGFSAGVADGYNWISVDGSGTPYVVYQDGSISYAATVMKYTGGNWVNISGSGLSSWVESTSIAIDRNGTPYIVCQGGISSQVTVMKYMGGSSWANIGTIYAGAATAIAIDTGGTPYVAYLDGFNNWKATVIKYSDTGWETVGGAGFSVSSVGYINVAIDRSGTPYVAYINDSMGSCCGGSGTATVMKFNGSGWVPVGSPGLLTGLAYYTAIAIDSSGTPYVFYSDSLHGYKGTVMKYKDASWQVVGTPGFSAGAISMTSIAIDSEGTPYVAYVDSAYGARATAMKYNGTNWVDVSSPGFSTGGVAATSIAINRNGTPYVVYQDLSTPHLGATVMRYGWPEQVANVSSAVPSISTFPDPSHGSFTLNLSATTIEEAQISITSIIGEKVKEVTATTNSDTQVQLDTPPGIYFISAITAQGTQTSKIVVW